MCNTYLYRQGMIFYVEDMSIDSANTTIPKKGRYWVIVSSNKHNETSPNVVAVPIYTERNEARSTHVTYNVGEDTYAIKCEYAMTIPRNKIKPGCYKGICSDELWNRIVQAWYNVIATDTVNTISTVKTTVKPATSNTTISDTIPATDNIDTTITTVRTKPVNKPTTVSTSTVRRYNKVNMTDERKLEYYNDYMDYKNKKTTKEYMFDKYNDVLAEATTAELSRTAYLCKKYLLNHNCVENLPTYRCPTIPESILPELYTDLCTMTYEQINAKYDFWNLKNSYELSQKKALIKRKIEKTGVKIH